MPHQHPKSRVYMLEASGVIIIAVLILVFSLVRYWRQIPWGLR